MRKLLYGVINIDIVGSRKLKGRRQLQNKLDEYIEYMNHRYCDILVAPISITLGDEWQIVTSHPYESYTFVQGFQQLLWQDNIELYSGIGIGSLSTEVNVDVRKMDGPCFYSARKAINITKGQLKPQKKYIYSNLNRVYFYNELNDFSYISDEVAATTFGQAKVNSVDESSNDEIYKRLYNLGEMINVLIENNEILKANMTKRQKKAFNDYQRYGSYRNIIDAYNGTGQYTSVGNISKMMNNAEYFTIQRNLETIKNLFKQYCLEYEMISLGVNPYEFRRSF